MAENIKKKMGRPRVANPKKYIKKGTPRTGRPEIYTDELAGEICEKLMNGRTITSICREEKMPSIKTVFSWLNDRLPSFKKDFLKSYLIARQIQGEVVADQAMDIADDGSNDTYYDIDKKGNRIKKIDYDNIQRSRLRVEHKRWLASKLYPRKFSDKLQLAGDEDKPLIPVKKNIIVNFVSPKKREPENAEKCSSDKQ